MCSKETVYLQDEESNQLYRVLVTPDEVKRVEIDLVFATEKLYEAKQKHDNSSMAEELTDIEETSNSAYSDEAEGPSTAFKWPHEAILLLIDEYNLRQNNFTSGKMSQKKIWSLIADELIKHGHNVTGPQCLSKFSGLKRTYKAIKDNNKKSGSGTITWPYFSHMDSQLQSKPYMSPLTTVSSTGKKTQAQAECSTSSVDSCLEEEKPVHKKPRQMSSIEKLIEDLKDERRTSEEAVERRHKENMELRLRLLHSFEKMVDIVGKK